MIEKKISLLGRRTYKINDIVTVNIPTVGLTRGENVEDEENFWSEAGLFTVSTMDMISELDDMGLDFSKMTDYSLFILLYSIRKEEKAAHKTNDLLFIGFNLWELELKQKEGGYILVDSNGETIIDEGTYDELSRVISAITGHKKPKRKKFGNEYIKKQWIESDRKHKERLKNSPKPVSEGGILDGIILRLVCNANFPYNFETINDVTLYDLIYSLKQIEKDISVSDLMQSRLVGVDLNKIDSKQRSRFVL